MNKKWFIVAAMVAFDGLSCHYPAIFFGEPIIEPNFVMRYLLHKFGASSVFVLIPLVVLFLWVVIKLASKFVIKYEKRYKNVEEAESGILNYLIVAYSIIIALEVLMLIRRFFGVSVNILQFFSRIEWLRGLGINIHHAINGILIAIAVIIYGIYDEIKWRMSKTHKK